METRLYQFESRYRRQRTWFATSFSAGTLCGLIHIHEVLIYLGPMLPSCGATTRSYLCRDPLPDYSCQCWGELSRALQAHRTFYICGLLQSDLQWASRMSSWTSDEQGTRSFDQGRNSAPPSLLNCSNSRWHRPFLSSMTHELSRIAVHVDCDGFNTPQYDDSSYSQAP